MKPTFFKHSRLNKKHKKHRKTPEIILENPTGKVKPLKSGLKTTSVKPSLSTKKHPVSVGPTALPTPNNKVSHHRPMTEIKEEPSTDQKNMIIVPQLKVDLIKDMDQIQIIESPLKVSALRDTICPPEVVSVDHGTTTVTLNQDLLTHHLNEMVKEATKPMIPKPVKKRVDTVPR